MKIVKTGVNLAISLTVVYLLIVIWTAIFPDWPVKNETIKAMAPQLVYTKGVYLVKDAAIILVFSGIVGMIYATINNWLGKEK